MSVDGVDIESFDGRWRTYLGDVSCFSENRDSVRPAPVPGVGVDLPQRMRKQADLIHERMDERFHDVGFGLFLGFREAGQAGIWATGLRGLCCIYKALHCPDESLS